MAGLPQFGALFRGARPLKLRATAFVANPLDQLDLLANTRLAAMKFKKQMGLFGQAGLAVGIDGADGDAVHELATRKRHTQLYRLSHRPYRRVDVRKGAHGGQDAFR